MHYYSTRGQDGPLGYEDALLSGLARDGGAFGGYLVTACDHRGDAFGRFARAGAPALDLRIGSALPFAVARQGAVGQGLIGL